MMDWTSTAACELTESAELKDSSDEYAARLEMERAEESRVNDGVDVLSREIVVVKGTVVKIALAAGKAVEGRGVIVAAADKREAEYADKLEIEACTETELKDESTPLKLDASLFKLEASALRLDASATADE